MEAKLTEMLAKLRLTIGFLGERTQFDWWHSSFFIQGNDAFLSPLFPRTKVLAQCQAITQAAAIIHDERIGIGHVYHLFRLPEDLEESIHEFLHHYNNQPNIGNQEAVMGNLKKLSDDSPSGGIGPVRIGNIQSLYEPESWQKAAGLYYQAFQQNRQVFPFFADVA